MTKKMKAKVLVTAEDGTIWSGEVELRAGGTPKSKVKRSGGTPTPLPAVAGPTAADLKVPARAFLSKFASKATAAGKFALVVAQIAQGAIGKDVTASDVEKVWRQNSGVLGGPYQTVYGTRSKEKGWVNSTKRGVFVLMDGWQEAANG